MNLTRLFFDLPTTGIRNPGVNPPSVSGLTVVSVKPVAAVLVPFPVCESKTELMVVGISEGGKVFWIDGSVEGALDDIRLVGRSEGAKDGEFVDSTFDGGLVLVLDGEIDGGLLVLGAFDSILVGMLDSSSEDGEAD